MEAQKAPVNNSPFSEKELEHFNDRLEEELDDAKEKISSFEDRLSEIEEKLDDTSSSAAHHQGNIASSEEEREKYYAMIEKQKEKVEEINMAKNRIKTGNYGICNVTGEPIKKERLEIKPYARYSVEAVKSANNVESHKITVSDST
ncbi:TraR/DksA C4-type zinc finger protein [Gracilimonas sp.]|uniref:TraR/DksA family transcriptional regulator n=1 Tax=Gracilimonas sp. TaxID=1974203 RepID=UPI0032EEC536